MLAQELLEFLLVDRHAIAALAVLAGDGIVHALDLDQGNARVVQRGQLDSFGQYLDAAHVDDIAVPADDLDPFSIYLN